MDVCIITKGNVEYLRNMELLQGKTYQRANPVVYKRGTAREASILLPSLHCTHFMVAMISLLFEIR